MYSATISGKNAFLNSLTGRSNKSAVVAVNDAGEFGFLPGGKSPYLPIGGRNALRLVMDCLEFRAFDYGDNVQVKRGQKL